MVVKTNKQEECMKKFRTVAAAAVLAMTGFAAFAQNLTGYEIAKRGDEVDEGKTCSYTATLTLTSKKGAVRTREIMCRNKDYGDVKKSVVVFVVPKDVEGVAYLSFDYPDKADGTKPDGDSWLFMPAMKKTRRIAGSGKTTTLWERTLPTPTWVTAALQKTLSTFWAKTPLTEILAGKWN